MIEHHAGNLPKGAIPLRAAFRFAPKDMLREYQLAVAALEWCPAQWPKRRRIVQFIPAEPYNPLADKARCAQIEVVRTRRKLSRWLSEQLISGNLTAIAQSDPPFGGWRPIPLEFWQRCRIKDWQTGHVIGINVDLRDVHIIEGDPTRLLEAMKTGAPGRPTSRHLVTAELDRWIVSGDLDRWIASGEIPAQLNRVAERLIKWLEDEHPQAPPLKQTAMENTIRGRFNEFRSARAARLGRVS